jgi:hypothetical protein
MISKSCIVTQVHIPDFDVQGGLTSTQKLDIVEFGLKHLRKFNPAAVIILTGHGQRPKGDALLECDEVMWTNISEPLNEHGYVVGMPAQFKYVSRGLNKAKELGFSRVLKTRGDCVVGIPEIVHHCDQILDSEQKLLLITQQTGQDRMGDCFMYGDTDLLCRTWDEGNQVVNADGLQNTAYHFRQAMSDGGDWLSLVRRTCAFRDVINLKFTCLRWNYQVLYDKLFAMMSPDYNFRAFHWGKNPGWCRFDTAGNMIAEPYLWSEKSFYAADPRC